MNATHRFQCQGCHTLLQIPLELLPANGPCPSCGHHLEVGRQELDQPEKVPAPAPVTPATTAKPVPAPAPAPGVLAPLRKPEARRIRRNPAGKDQVRVALVSSIIAAFFLTGSLLTWWTVDAFHSALNHQPVETAPAPGPVEAPQRAMEFAQVDSAPAEE